jgi:hypothetical protein
MGNFRAKFGTAKHTSAYRPTRKKLHMIKCAVRHPPVVPSFWSSSAEGSTLAEILSQNTNKLVDESSNKKENKEPQKTPREEEDPSSPSMSPAKTLPLGHAKHTCPMVIVLSTTFCRENSSIAYFPTIMNAKVR